MSNPTNKYGLTAVPASAQDLLRNTPCYPAPTSPPIPIPVSATQIPETPLSQRINAYACTHLPEETYNHSRRVYHFGLAIKRYRFPFADWDFDDETYFLACLLHDIGTTEANITATKLSFEFFGGVLALRVLQHDTHGYENQDEAVGTARARDRGPQPGSGEATAPREQAESVAEAIIRHQDLSLVGSITALGQLLQLATIFDNIGVYSDLVHADTIKDVSIHFPRKRWSHCFAATIRRENSLKPWAHTTALGEEEFPANVLGNTLMAPYE
ncbi:uncharacterized protein N7479_008776 [Penicillium vulpinum]|uniref:HD/PDEase domain-containing protein n=1 Tax=Penicillium vulpinum TaxID=29845 RepID=A0A1V6S1X3_9EURO|nr:uncharacterized protein N7479_008776 [Penicillium vulpinum]KAJ5950363.1 hypothetical protein N7479_008776 [Penicillium vulpinum]OQE07744.1 hypothetical protein PENVUL_c012G07014 [Penicillium vulpinum]